MKIHELEEVKIYVSERNKFKMVKGLLYFKTSIGGWIGAGHSYNKVLEMDFEPCKPKTTVKFIEYYNPTYECLQLVTEGYNTNSELIPTGETTTREIEL